jgi:hypothetical protein
LAQLQQDHWGRDWFGSGSSEFDSRAHPSALVYLTVEDPNAIGTMIGWLDQKADWIKIKYGFSWAEVVPNMKQK